MIAPNSKPILATAVPIKNGEKYLDPYGRSATADCDGLLLSEFGQIICAERLATVLGQLGGWKVKAKK